MPEKPSYRELEQRVKELEENLAQTEHFFTSVLNYIPDLIFVKDEAHRWVFLNDAFCDALGHRREALIGKTDYDFHTQEEADIFWEKDNLVFDSEGTNVNEEGYTGPEGETHTILTSKAAFRDENGRKLLVGISHDISLRKYMEEQVEIERKFSESLINSLPGVMYVFDQLGNYVRWNKNYETVTGYSAAQIKNMNPLDFIAPEDKIRVRKAIERVFDKGEASVEAGFSTVNGVNIPYLFTGYKFNQNNLNYLVGVGLDISDRVRTEKEKENLITKLQDTLSQVNQLSGFLPICASCKKIRDDKGYWNQIEAYIKDHSEAEFSHSICPDCAKKLYPDLRIKPH